MTLQRRASWCSSHLKQGTWNNGTFVLRGQGTKRSRIRRYPEQNLQVQAGQILIYFIYPSTAGVSEAEELACYKGFLAVGYFVSKSYSMT
ncbi:uncharacterized protein [Lolium perenne]|uniref:uncharacterized protein isoform X4 n=1 Tax=Lolium perenne TaxID=4522 RepID=UPI003A99931F